MQEGVLLQVPKEESIAEIRDRYMDINSHAMSYNWKALKSAPGSSTVSSSNMSLQIVKDQSSGTAKIN